MDFLGLTPLEWVSFVCALAGLLSIATFFWYLIRFK